MFCQSGWESDGGTLKPLTCHSSLFINMLSMCKCGNVQNICGDVCHLLPQITSTKLSELLLAKCGVESLLYMLARYTSIQFSSIQVISKHITLKKNKQYKYKYKYKYK